ARAVRPGAVEAHAGGELQPRHAAEAADQRGAGAPAGVGRGGRADGGAGPEGCAADQGSAPLVRSAGRHRVPLDPHPRGGGGAVRPHRDPARGARPRHRHDGRSAPGGGGRHGGAGGRVLETDPGGAGEGGGGHGGRGTRRAGHMTVVAHEMPGRGVARARRPAEMGVLALLGPKLRAAARRATGAGVRARVAVLGGLGLVFWLALFGVLYRLLVYFRSAEGIGDVLAAKLLGLILLTFLSVLLLSNVVTALSTFFLARDLEMLLAAPVDGVRLYLARLLETMLHSSWMVVLVLVPVLIAYGWVYDGGLTYAAVAAASLVSFLLLPAVVGAAVTLLLVNVFPARRARDLLALLALFAAAGLVVLVRLLRPERLARPEGFRDLVDFVAALRSPSSPWLPSEWAAEAMMAALGAGGDLFPLLLLTSTAAAFVVLGAWAHERWYRTGFSRAQEGAERRRE